MSKYSKTMFCASSEKQRICLRGRRYAEEGLKRTEGLEKEIVTVQDVAKVR